MTLFALVTLNPLLIVALSVAFIVAAIAGLRLHAFFALVLAALLVALLTAAGAPGAGYAKAVEAVMTEFGSTAGKLGFAIALAAVIGLALMESGAADKIVRRLIAVCGESRAAWVLGGCAFVLAGPVFVDTVFLLMIPLARALSQRTGRDYLLYLLAIGSGAVVANGVVPPAPGPLFVAETLKIDVGHAILVGVLFGVPPALGGLAIARWFNAHSPVALRRPAGLDVPVNPAPEETLPGFWVSIAPVLLPLGLIAAAAATSLAGPAVPASAAQALQFFGNKNIALLLGAGIALAVLARQKKIPRRELGRKLGAPLETAGVIILVVAAGGAYGAMIKSAGVGEAVRAAAGGQALNHVLLAWIITAIIRAAQGSATVATIAGAGIMVSIAGPGGYGVHPLYILLAIGFGSKCLPWMNDAGFWVVSRMSGLTPGEMLQTWTPVLSLISVLGLIEVLVASLLWPQLWF